MVAAVRDAAASHGLRCEVNSEPEEATRQAYILCRTFLPQALPCRFYDFTCTYRNDRDEIELLARTAHSFKASFKCHITDLQSNVCMREGGREGGKQGWRGSHSVWRSRHYVPKDISHVVVVVLQGSQRIRLRQHPRVLRHKYELPTHKGARSLPMLIQCKCYLIGPMTA